MIKAKKKFGQNFLCDSSVLDKIIQSIPNDSENIIEIGAGLGDLTQRLVVFPRLTSFEIDEDLFDFLKNKFAKELQEGKLKFVFNDVLNVWDSEGISDKKKYFLVANLPYYIATKIILKAIDDEYCDGFIVMIQKEVALKFSAKSTDKECSSLSILANLQGECELLFDVSPDAFNPPPKVTSSVIKMKKNKSIFDFFSDPSEYNEFKEFLKICFIAPRKTLLKNLSLEFDKKILSEIFEKFEISNTTRAHELDFALFLKIFKNIRAKNGESRK